MRTVVSCRAVVFLSLLDSFTRTVHGRLPLLHTGQPVTTVASELEPFPMAARPATTSAVLLDHEDAIGLCRAHTPRSGAHTALPGLRVPRSEGTAADSPPSAAPLSARESLPRATIAPATTVSSRGEAHPPPRKPKASAATLGQAADAVEAMYAELMQEQQDCVGGIESYLELHDATRHRRKLALCREWNEGVFDKSQDAIDHEVGKRSAAEIGRRRRAQYDKFLTAQNEKPEGLFRDIIMPDYNPLESRDHCVRYNPTSFDPLKIELRGGETAKVRAQPGDVHGAPYSRAPEPERRLDPTAWTKLDATPYGHCGRGDLTPAPARVLSTGRVLADQYDVSPEARSEQPRGKRCVR